jgi:hypothetical protein
LGWTATDMKNADAAFTHVEEKRGHMVAVLGGHGDLEMQAHCRADRQPCVPVPTLTIIPAVACEDGHPSHHSRGRLPLWPWIFDAPLDVLKRRLTADSRTFAR